MIEMIDSNIVYLQFNYTLEHGRIIINCRLVKFGIV